MDLAGDKGRLYSVVVADTAGHQKAFDEAEDGGDAGPREEKVEDASTVATEIEVVDTEAAEEESEQDADDLVLAGALVFSVEPGALLVGHVRGVDGVDGLHLPSS